MAYGDTIVTLSHHIISTRGDGSTFDTCNNICMILPTDVTGMSVSECVKHVQGLQIHMRDVYELFDRSVFVVASRLLHMSSVCLIEYF